MRASLYLPHVDLRVRNIEPQVRVALRMFMLTCVPLVRVLFPGVLGLSSMLVLATLYSLQSFGEFYYLHVLATRALKEVAGPIIEAQSILKYYPGLGDPLRVRRTRLERVGRAPDRHEGGYFYPIPSDSLHKVLQHGDASRYPDFSFRGVSVRTCTSPGSSASGNVQCGNHHSNPYQSLSHTTS